MSSSSYDCNSSASIDINNSDNSSTDKQQVRRQRQQEEFNEESHVHIVDDYKKQTTTRTATATGQPSTQRHSQTGRTPEHSFEMDESEVDVTVSRGRSTDGGGGGARSSIRSFISNVSRSGSNGGGRFMGAARHTAGLVLLIGVVILWTLGNFLGSSIFANHSYAKPFFLTYLNTSIFVFAMIPSWIKWAFQRWRAGTLRTDSGRLLSAITVKSLLHRGTTDPLLQDEFPRESEAFLKPNGVPVSPSEVSSSSTTPINSPREPPPMYLGLIPTARLSLIFCLLWFGANYFAMSCLQHTTVASTTILTSTASVWTLLIGALSRTEKFTWRKLCGVLASLIGIIIISRADLTRSTDPVSSAPAPSMNTTDTMTMLTTRAIEEFPDKSPGEIAIGDAQALFSAIIYGFYTITLKRSTLKAEPLELHMPTFFGLVGVFNIIFLLPMFPILDITGIEPFQLPPTSHIWTVLIVNSITSFASDIMWAYAMVLTSPIVVTVGLSLSIPLSLVGEVIVQDRFEGWIYWVGALIVVGSFVFVEREEVKEVEERVEIGCVRHVEEGDGGPSNSGLRIFDDIGISSAGAGVGTFHNGAGGRVSQDLSDLIDSDDDEDDRHDRKNTAR